MGKKCELGWSILFKLHKILHLTEGWLVSLNYIKYCSLAIDGCWKSGPMADSSVWLAEFSTQSAVIMATIDNINNFKILIK